MVSGGRGGHGREAQRSGEKYAQWLPDSQTGRDLELPLEVNVTFKGLLVDETPYTKGSTTPKAAVPAGNQAFKQGRC